MSRHSSFRALAALAAILVVGASFYAGLSAGIRKAAAPDAASLTSPAGTDLSPLLKAWSVLDEKFVPASTTKAVSDEEKLWGAITGLTESLGDPYTVFLPPADAQIFEDDISGNFEGVGMEIGIRDGVLTVVAPLKNTPAARAGILAGDSILEIGGVATDDMTVEEAVKLIRGKRGTTVSFLLRREGVADSFAVEVVRDVIDIPTIDTEIADGVFIVSVHNFSAVAPNLFRQALRDFVDANTDKLVVDVRDNPGGFLEAAVDMASWFLPPGAVVVREDFGPEERQRIHRSKGYNVFNENLKLVVLVNRGSASAAEIFAGALAEHEKAVLIGEKTFGKGSVQELVKVTDEASLKVTIARWLTPFGRSISDGGLSPDIAVEDARTSREGGDAARERAIDYLRSLGDVPTINTVNPFR